MFHKSHEQCSKPSVISLSKLRRQHGQMEKQRWEESERSSGAEKKWEDQRGKSEKKDDAGARNSKKVTIHRVFPIICGSGGSKSRLARAACAEPCGQMRDEKLHAVVARRTCPRKNIQSRPFSVHSWRLRCRKSARRCGAKHISKWKCTKHVSSRALLEVEMSKRCTLLWRETHFEVKSVKKLKGSNHFWTFRCRFAWQAHGIAHLVKSEKKNVEVL